MWVEFAVGSLLCSERFFSGFSGTPLSSKTNISKFQFDQESGRWRTILWMSYLQIIIYLFIYFTAQVVAMSVTVDNSPIQATFTRKIILNLLMQIDDSWVQTVHSMTKFVWHMYIVSFHTNLLIYNNITIITCHLTSHKLKEVVHKYVKLHSHFFFQNYQIDNPIMGHQQPCQEKQPVKTTTKTTCKLRELLTTTPA